MKTLFIILALACGAAAQTYTFSTNPPVATFGTSTARYRSFMSMIKTPSGCIIGYRDGPNHVGQPSYNILQVSTDGCVTFTPYSGVSYDCGGFSGCLWSDNSAGDDARGPGFIYDGARLIAFANVNDATSSASLGCEVSYSDDNGASWTAPAVFAAGYRWCFANSVFTYNSHPCITANPRPTVSTGTQQWICSLDHGVTWTEIHNYPVAVEQDENAVYWIDNNNGLILARKATGTPTLLICTTTTGPLGFTCADSNITPILPLCAVSGGTFNRYSEVSPSFYKPVSIANRITLMYSERQVCDGASSAMNNYLRAITFDPAAVIASPSSLPASQTLNVGAKTNGSVDYGYQSMAETSGSNVLITWYGHFTDFTIRPIPITMTGSYQSASRTLLTACLGTGTGLLASDDGVISCTCTAGTATGTCSDTAGSGSVIRLTGTPVLGSGLQGITTSGGCSTSGTNPYSVTLSANCTSTATFTILAPSTKLKGNSIFHDNSVIQ